MHPFYQEQQCLPTENLHYLAIGLPIVVQSCDRSKTYVRPARIDSKQGIDCICRGNRQGLTYAPLLQYSHLGLHRRSPDCQATAGAKRPSGLILSACRAADRPLSCTESHGLHPRSGIRLLAARTFPQGFGPKDAENRWPRRCWICRRPGPRTRCRVAMVPQLWTAPLPCVLL